MNQLYRNQDMVRVGCHDCRDCHDCCTGMGDTIWVDPLDAYLLSHNLNKSFQELMEGPIELHVEEGLILPNLRMVPEKGDTCYFLNEEKRCSIHAFRPGFCRLFPLGRQFEGEKLSYFLLEDACPMKNKTKMKVGKWLGVDAIASYEHYLVRWHSLTKSLRYYCNREDVTEEDKKSVNMRFLQYFFLVPYEPTTNDIKEVYEIIEQRITEFETLVR